MGLKKGHETAERMKAEGREDRSHKLENINLKKKQAKREKDVRFELQYSSKLGHCSATVQNTYIRIEIRNKRKDSKT